MVLSWASWIPCFLEKGLARELKQSLEHSDAGKEVCFVRDQVTLQKDIGVTIFHLSMSDIHNGGYVFLKGKNLFLSVKPNFTLLSVKDTYSTQNILLTCRGKNGGN